MPNPILTWHERGSIGMARAIAHEYEYDVWPADPTNAETRSPHRYSVFSVDRQDVVLRGLFPSQKEAIMHCENLARARAKQRARRSSHA